MIQIKDKSKCCGCTACQAVCPKHAIVMQPDEEGFLYPTVDTALCIDCGLCDKTCPISSPAKPTDFLRTTYVMRSKDSEVLMNSTSGGFMTPLTEWLFENDGVLCAATYDEDFHVVHRIMMRDDIDMKKMRGSKYVQSSLGDVFSTIRAKLNSGTLVCFVGTTCQVYGLKAYLRRSYENLITVDLVCHGTPSPKLWDKYLSYQKEKYCSDITEIVFRNKTYGYHSGTMKIRFANGKTYLGSARVDYMLKSFFKEISSRPACYACSFKVMERVSDFTIYDSWHAAELVEGLKDDDRGYTNVIVQSENGSAVFEKIKDRYEAFPTDTEAAIARDGKMVRHSATPHPRRNEYYVDLDEHDLPTHIKKYIPVSRRDRMIEGSKNALYKLGLFKIAGKFVKK